MEDIFYFKKSSIQDVYTEDNYKEMEKNNEIKNILKNIPNNAKKYPDNLFKSAYPKDGSG